MRPDVELIGPAKEGVHLGPGVGQQLGVHAKPSGEGEPAVQLVAVLADLGDRRLPADHGHDPLVVVVELRGRRAARGPRLDGVGGEAATLDGHLGHTGQRFVIDLERGKPTVQLQKVLAVLDLLGLELVIQPKPDTVAVDVS